MASKVPWMVELRGDSAICKKLENTEPQFHWKWRGDKIICRNWSGGKNKPKLKI
jgi:hypothetical protein